METNGKFITSPSARSPSIVDRNNEKKVSEEKGQSQKNFVGVNVSTLRNSGRQ
jgi:hypothetical protein